MAEGRVQSKHWCFTINNWTEEDEKDLGALEPLTTYLVVGKESGEEGTPHLQGYLVFEKVHDFSWIKKRLSRAHIEKARGTPEQASNYCKKEGDFYESGALPLQKGDAEKKRWEDAKHAAIRGDLDSIPPDIYVRHYSTLKRIAFDHQPMPADAGATTGVWIYGPPGVGKSRGARERYPGAYLKLCNKWWDGYTGEKYVIIDDFDTCHTVLSHHLKLWADRYAFSAEQKGSTIRIRPEVICITSNYKIEDLWTDQSVVEALKRRFKCIHMDVPFALK